jgi:SagB-type dehydrogenase family enzyme
MADKPSPIDGAIADNSAADGESAHAERLAAIVAYHEESKHRVGRMAPSLGYMDWANQPEPFRRYKGCETIPLPLLDEDPDLAYETLFTPSSASPAPVSKAAIGVLLELSVGLSAWKVSGASRWALRMVPSSGNLHPTEAYVIVCAAEDLAPGVYHYHPLEHLLERRLAVGPDLLPVLKESFPPPGLWIAFTSIFWREAWKYGLRAYRYCQLDMGHALAGLSLAARIKNWRCRLVHGVKRSQLGALLGLERHRLPPAEAEYAECLCHLGGDLAPPPKADLAPMTPHLPDLAFQGSPNRLSRSHEHWHAIDRVARLASGGAAPPLTVLPPWPPQPAAAVSGPAAAVIRGRRSAVAYTPRREMPQAAFLAILLRTLPRFETPPFATGIGEPAIDLLVFVHRVNGLRPGLYALCRHPAHRDRLQAACDPRFLWEVHDPQIPLFFLKPGDYVYDAIHISCDQTIAGYSAFSLGMLARFHPYLKTAPGAYRLLFWEAGLVGHLLYLEAEAQGYRGTGIGCFFDDGMHNLLGLKEREFQSLYHFTIGTPVADTRLKTLPAYHHLERAD